MFESDDDPKTLSRRARTFYFAAAAVGALVAILAFLASRGALGVSFEQAGSSLNLFAETLTNQEVFGWLVPTTWLQNVNPIFIVIFAPVFGVLWTTLAARHRNPSIPTKFGLGLLGLSAGFFVIAWRASFATEKSPVSPAWLVVTYFLFTVGELCLSPVGLSSMTTLAPRDRVGQMMGIWFVAAALGNLIAGLLAGGLENTSPHSLFLYVAIVVGAFAVLALLVARGVDRLIGRDPAMAAETTSIKTKEEGVGPEGS